MIHWNRFPLLRVLIPFIGGVGAALSMDRSFHIHIAVFIVLAFFCGLFSLFAYKWVQYRQRWIFGLAVTIFFLLCGFEITMQRTAKFNAGFPEKISEQSRFLAMRITEPISVKEKSCKAVVELLAISDSNGPQKALQWHVIKCNAIAYVAKDSMAEQLKYGDIILADAPLKEVAPPQNPYQYDYKSYLARKGVYHQVYIRNNKWRMLSRGHTNPIYKLSYSARDRLLSIFENNNLAGREYAVISALLIGYTDKIDPELMKDYSGTGAIHILSVSGMHVGVVFVVMNLLLFFLDKNKYLRILKGLLLLAFIWFYAMITGLSPCILRAAATFSFIIIGRVTQQQSNIYNTLAASILCLLIVNPYFITDVGFQLSYLAVIGIVAIYEPIYKLWRPRYKLIEKIWSLIAVSITAQLATFPLALLYFHQFPNYFLATNLIAVPLSTVIIYCGMGVVGCSFFPWLSAWLGKITSWLIWLMNTMLHHLESLPHAVSRGLVINTFEMVMLYAAIVLLFMWLMSKKNNLLAATFILFIGLACSFTWRNYAHHTQRAMIVYSVAKSAGADLIHGNTTYFIADTGLINDPSKQDFSIQGNRWHRGIKQIRSLQSVTTNFPDNEPIYCRNNFLNFCGKRIALLNSCTSNTKKIKIDYLLITANIDIKMNEILAQYEPGLIILCSAVSNKKARQWQNECKKASVPCYSVINSGAFVAEF
ncbi:MAG: ComEC/Rec2 family competence protein [Bacteroidota bacterium]